MIDYMAKEQTPCTKESENTAERTTMMRELAKKGVITKRIKLEKDDKILVVEEIPSLQVQIQNLKPNQASQESK